MNALELLLEAAYEKHLADITRRDSDYTRELNAKLGQINAQAETIKDLVATLKKHRIAHPFYT